MNNPDRLLVVDDDQCIRKYLANVGRRLNFEVATAADRSELERKIPTFWPSVVLLDLQIPGCDGIQILKLLKDLNSDAKIILVSGMDEKTVATAMQLGQILDLNMAGTLKKPVLIDALRDQLNKVRNSRISIDADELRRAIENEDIRPLYQPKAHRQADGQWRVQAVEALARWHRQDNTVVLPSEFIDTAEQLGLLPDLTHSLLRQVVAQLRHWDDTGLQMSAAVNVSPALLTDTSFPDQVQALMDEYEIESSRLMFELTESAVMRNAGLAMEILSRLRIKGFGLAIDDFGTGYSSLEQLYRMPFSELKVDRFLVREIGIRSEAATIVEAIIMLAHKLELSVCAEGVESRQVMTFLEDAGCDNYQGYYVGRPTSAEALLQRVGEFESGGLDACTDEPGQEVTGFAGATALRRPLPILCL